MVYRTDRGSPAGGGCHGFVSDFYAAWRFGKSVWHWRRKPDFTAAWKGRAEKCRKNRNFCHMGISCRHIVLFSFDIRLWQTGAAGSGNGRRNPWICKAVSVLDCSVRRDSDGTQPGSCQYCLCSGTGQDSEYWNVGGRNPQCGA